MKFAYAKEPLVDLRGKLTGIAYRPVIDVVLINGENRVGYRALVDSGADHNLFPGVVADVAGLTFDGKDVLEFTGIGGAKVKAYGAETELEIGGVRFRAKVYFSAKLPENGRAVLGQVGFFDKFRVKFEYDKKELEVTPI